MAEVKFQREIVKFCINCGAEFENSQPSKDASDNVVTCGDENSGCGAKFVSKKVDE